MPRDEAFFKQMRDAGLHAPSGTISEPSPSKESGDLPSDSGPTSAQRGIVDVNGNVLLDVSPEDLDALLVKMLAWPDEPPSVGWWHRRAMRSLSIEVLRARRRAKRIDAFACVDDMADVYAGFGRKERG